MQKELDRQTGGPGDRSVANAQRAVSGDISGPERKHMREAEDEPLADNATTPSAKEVKLDDEYGHKPVECPKVTNLLSAILQSLTRHPKTEMTTNSSQVRTIAAGQTNMNSADKRPCSFGGTGKKCPQLGKVGLSVILDCWTLTAVKNTKITQQIAIENDPTCNEGAQNPIPRIPPNPGPSNRQTQGRPSDPQGEESGLLPPNPVGIRNFHFACYANTTIQALARSPEFSEHYRALAAAHGINAKVAAFVAAHAVRLEKPGKATRRTLQGRGGLRYFLGKHKDEM